MVFRIATSLLIVGLTSVALAKSLQKLPAEIQDQMPYFEIEMLESITERFMCQVELNSGEFSLESTEKQDPEYAEYSGELSSFVIKVTTDLGQHGCEDRYDQVTCRYKFDLYDERAYQIDRQNSECD